MLLHGGDAHLQVALQGQQVSEGIMIIKEVDDRSSPCGVAAAQERDATTRHEHVDEFIQDVISSVRHST